MCPAPLCVVSTQQRPGGSLPDSVLGTEERLGLSCRMFSSSDSIPVFSSGLCMNLIQGLKAEEGAGMLLTAGSISRCHPAALSLLRGCGHGRAVHTVSGSCVSLVSHTCRASAEYSSKRL